MLDVVGYQMADGTAGGLASGLEAEIEDLRAKQRAEEDRRLGRVRRAQARDNGGARMVARMPGPSRGDPKGTLRAMGGSTVNAGGSMDLLMGEGGGSDGEGSDGEGGRAPRPPPPPSIDIPVAVGSDGAVRVEVSAEMQARLDLLIQSQVGAVGPVARGGWCWEGGGEEEGRWAVNSRGEGGREGGGGER